MNILITGGTGFVGKEIAKTLLKAGSLTLKNGETHKISKITLFDCFAGEGVPTDDRVEVVLGDINDKPLLQKLIQDVDIIWHLAAVVSSAAEESSQASSQGPELVQEPEPARQGAARTQTLNAVIAHRQVTIRLIHDAYDINGDGK